jgi:hypothetical protein
MYWLFNCLFAENGTYIGLDLGGTNFRIVLVILTDGVAETSTKYFNIHRELLDGPCERVTYSYNKHYLFKLHELYTFYLLRKICRFHISNHMPLI